MPYKDGTGPMGGGQPGRGMGPCGRGMRGGGYGRGAGMGRRGIFQASPAAQDEAEALKARVEELEKRLNDKTGGQK
ncbi:MAG TPA: cytoplasmic protein [Elusimicrobia bacterium]|nr:cytoplasmic protein [Elusimicrobiota bacterium]